MGAPGAIIIIMGLGCSGGVWGAIIVVIYWDPRTMKFIGFLEPFKNNFNSLLKSFHIQQLYYCI